MSIETTVALISIAGLVILAFVKAYNIHATLNKKPLYPGIFVYLGLALALLFWVFYFLSLAGTLQYSETITSGADVYTIATTTYVSLNFYFPAVNFLLLIALLMTIIETLVKFTSLMRGTRQ